MNSKSSPEELKHDIKKFILRLKLIFEELESDKNLVKEEVNKRIQDFSEDINTLKTMGEI